jgi:hypothetical protein
VLDTIIKYIIGEAQMIWETPRFIWIGVLAAANATSQETLILLGFFSGDA